MAISFTKKNKNKSYIDMIPMIDIIFQLTIFFMVATTFKVTSGMELELPKAATLSDITTTQLSVYIVNENQIMVGNMATSFSELPNVILNESKNSSARSVIIYGDKNMEYNLLIEVMDILRKNGYMSIDLALTKRM
jgi:biopolymer transport protein ExbD